MPPDATVDAVMDRLLVQGSRDAYVVGGDGRVLGHLSRDRLAMLMLAEHRSVHTRRQLMERVAGGLAGDLMTMDCPVARPEEELDNVFQRQLEHGIEDLPVVDESGRMLGAVNLTAVLREIRRIIRNGSGEL